MSCHSRMRRKEIKLALQNFFKDCKGRFFWMSFQQACQMLRSVRKSDCGSLSFPWASSASASLSSGLSLGSWMLKAEAIMEISRRQFRVSASMMMRESLGSMGILAMMRPIGVSSYTGSKVSGVLLEIEGDACCWDEICACLLRRLIAPSSSRSLNPSWILLSWGGSINGNWFMSPILRKSILRITSARFDRRISGLV